MRREGKGSAAGNLFPFVAAAGATLLLALAGGKLILAEKIGQNAQPALSAGIAAMCAMLAALLSAKRRVQKRFLWGMLAAGIYFSILLLSNLLFFSSNYGRILPIAIAVIIGGLLGSFIGAWKGR